jgi:hypothetical protein
MLEDGHMMGYNQYIQYVEPISIYPTSVKAGKDHIHPGRHGFPALHL